MLVVSDGNSDRRSVVAIRDWGGSICGGNWAVGNGGGRFRWRRRQSEIGVAAAVVDDGGGNQC